MFWIQNIEIKAYFKEVSFSLCEMEVNDIIGNSSKYALQYTTSITWKGFQRVKIVRWNAVAIPIFVIHSIASEQVFTKELILSQSLFEIKITLHSVWLDFHSSHFG